ncbi:MAG: hypothetical protein ABWZ25_13440 [Chitinophagaceae bacterium]
MNKIFTERTFVVVLFVITLVVFAFASEDARHVRMRDHQAAGAVNDNKDRQVAADVQPTTSFNAARE